MKTIENADICCAKAVSNNSINEITFTPPPPYGEITENREQLTKKRTNTSCRAAINSQIIPQNLTQRRKAAEPQRKTTAFSYPASSHCSLLTAHFSGFQLAPGVKKYILKRYLGGNYEKISMDDGAYRSAGSCFYRMSHP
jgi:hypothetical protein